MTGSGKFAQSGQPGPSGRDSYSRDVLEFDAILELVHRFLSGPLAEPLLARIEPRTDLEAIRRDHELCGEAREVLRESTRPGLGTLSDPPPTKPKLAIESWSCTGL